MNTYTSFSPIMRHSLETTPPSSPRESILGIASNTLRSGRNLLRQRYLDLKSDPLVLIYNEKKKAGTLTQLEELLVHEVIELRSYVAKMFSTREQTKESFLLADETFEMSASVQNLIRSTRLGSRTSDVEYQLIQCMQSLKHSQKELQESKKIIAEQSAMIRDLMAQNKKLMARIEGL